MSAAAASAAAPATITRELLSSHATRATFSGVKQHPCRFRTSLCPDRCGHGGAVAEFAVDVYLSHEKPGQYGDDPVAVYYQRVSEAPPHVAAAIAALSPGDKVRLDFVHDYVTRVEQGGSVSKFPERTITLLEADGGA